MRIGYVEGAVYAGVLSADLARIRHATPRLRIELKSLSTSAQLSALEARTIELGYGYWPPPRTAALGARLLHEEPFVIAVSKHTFARGVKPRLAELNAIPLITMPEAAAARGRAQLMSALASVGLHPEVQIEASDPAILLALVDARMGFAVLQQSLRSLAPRGTRFLPLPRRFPMRLQVYSLQLSAAVLPSGVAAALQA